MQCNKSNLLFLCQHACVAQNLFSLFKLTFLLFLHKYGPLCHLSVYLSQKREKVIFVALTAKNLAKLA